MCSILNSEAFQNFLIALFGAGFGASAAFIFQNRKAKNDQKDKEYGLLIEALFLLIARYNSLLDFCAKHIVDEKIKEELSFQIIFRYFHQDRINFSGLAFLGDKSDSAFLANIRVTESNYFSFVDALNVRNKEISNFISSVYAADSNANIGKVMGEGQRVELKLIADETIHLAGSALNARNKTEIDLHMLRDIIKKRFKGRHCPSVKPDPKRNKTL